MESVVDHLDLVAGDGSFDGGLLHDFASNPGVRSRMQSGSPPTIRYDEQWEQELPRPARFLVTTMTRPLLRTYGYPVGTSR
ncbi:MAG: hypothetical protein U5K30_02050 [Acidimicrobiales bacterium]|nr:hypothetical protein [Acidimicrobiales bacterium]